ncbi:MAG: tRNA pseudouridine(38-40) synthase TruA [Akkermansiaceae bacterium]|nr:tRNA pseudouridine(38-40) synthase TruA [Akkermansiaceae bacterium]
MRVLLTLAYDGRSLDGWQSQPSGNTVQDRVENALSATAKSAIRLHGSGRTDAGVHALAQTAHFDAPGHLRMTPQNWLAALNAQLPPEIRILSAQEVLTDFHARFSAIAKTYRYDIETSPVLSPFRHGLSWHLPRGLDIAALVEVLGHFHGHHDFEAFCARRGNETEETDHHRTIHEARVEETEGGLSVTWRGDGFLYKMVRILTGTAVLVAQGRLDPAQVIAWLDQPAGLPHGRSSHCAPAAGLFLEKVHYPQEALTGTAFPPA